MSGTSSTLSQSSVKAPNSSLLESLKCTETIMEFEHLAKVCMGIVGKIWGKIDMRSRNDVRLR